jgi:hypothetical protein
MAGEIAGSFIGLIARRYKNGILGLRNMGICLYKLNRAYRAPSIGCWHSALPFRFQHIRGNVVKAVCQKREVQITQLKETFAYSKTRFASPRIISSPHLPTAFRCLLLWVQYASPGRICAISTTSLKTRRQLLMDPSVWQSPGSQVQVSKAARAQSGPCKIVQLWRRVGKLTNNWKVVPTICSIVVRM